MSFKKSKDNSLFKIFEITELIFKNLHWDDLHRCSLVSKQWNEMASNDKVALGSILRLHTKYSFFPKGFYKTLLQETDSKEVHAHFKKTTLPMLKDFHFFEGLLKQFNITLDKAPAEYCEIYGGIKFGKTSTSCVNPRTAMFPASWIPEIKEMGDPWVVLMLKCEEVSNCIGAYEVLPRKGTIYFISDDWSEGTFVKLDDGTEERVKHTFKNTAKYVRPEKFDLSSVMDELYIDTEFTWGISEIEFTEALNEWEDERKGKFRSGHYPHQKYIRFGGRQPYDGQGNFCLEEDERVIVQTSHPSDGLWCAYGYYTDSKDLEGDVKSYDNAKSAIVDDC